jgi:hypothetical protein
MAPARNSKNRANFSCWGEDWERVKEKEKEKIVVPSLKSSQVNTLPKAKSKTRSKQNKDMHKCSSVCSERGVPLPVLTSGGE